MNDTSGNPYAAPASPRDDPQRWSLDSPLLRDGWAHWAGRLISISLGVGLISAVWAFLTTNLDAQAPRPWPLWYLVPGAIISSLPAWALGLSFRGFRSAPVGRRFSAGRFMAVVYVTFLFRALLWSIVTDGGVLLGSYQLTNWLATGTRTPAQIVMLAFVTFTWGGRVRWLRLIVLSIGGVLLWRAFQQVMVIPIFQATQLPTAQAAWFFAFEDAALWTLSFGAMLPFATATGRVDE